MLFLCFVFLAVFEVRDTHLAPFLELGDGEAEVMFVFEALVEFFEVVVVHHSREGFGFVEEVAFFFCAFLF